MDDSPIMKVGRYEGMSINSIPKISYLRWLITQKFPKEYLDAAMRKIEKSDFEDSHLSTTRHSIDMFSKRFLHKWVESESGKGDKADGIATFLVKLAERAWEEGKDISKRRHQDDGIIKELDGILYVFGVNENFPDYKDLITVMEE